MTLAVSEAPVIPMTPSEARATLARLDKPVRGKVCRRCRRTQGPDAFPLAGAPPTAHRNTRHWCAGCLVEGRHVTEADARRYRVGWHSTRDRQRREATGALTFHAANSDARQAEAATERASRERTTRLRAVAGSPEARALSHRLTVELVRRAEADPVFAESVRRAADMMRPRKNGQRV